MESGFSKFFRSSVRDAEINLRAGQRIIFEIKNSQGSYQIPKSNPQLLHAEIKKKIACRENIKTVSVKQQTYQLPWSDRLMDFCLKVRDEIGVSSIKVMNPPIDTRSSLFVAKLSPE
ncbi:hypothetical protein TNCV_2453051 [Trichonephila clavipes]|nr:hypothetical protein TNCV_2453051 [Trichonephila clavipes]